jgi:rhodanese-related sulfurtransferase
MMAGALGCASSTPTAQPTEATKAPEKAAAYQEVGVDKVAAMLAEKNCQPVDANSPQTRAEKGTLPGAILLTSYAEYTSAELPAEKDKNLVFYCSNERCGASHAAAKRAAEQGYTNVYVMNAGIAGWRDAGKDVAYPAK